MDIAAIVRSFGEIIGNSATVKSVYGEPVKTGDRVVLPVASIRFAFGGGGGGGGETGTPKHGEGGGGGGTVSAKPCGLVEVTPEGARFIYYREPVWVAAVVAAGFLLGMGVGLTRAKCRSKPG